LSDIGVVDESTWFFNIFVKYRVTWGFFLGVVFVWFADPTKTSILVGLIPAVLGEAIRTWSSGTIVKNQILTTVGPYAMTRNPLYVGNFLLGLGVAAMGGEIALVVLFTVFFLSVYSALIKKEEKYLLERYGDGFFDYCRKVPRFFPKLSWPLPTAPYDGLRMWKKHKEWKAWLGLYAAVLFLLIKARGI